MEVSSKNPARIMSNEQTTPTMSNEQPTQGSRITIWNNAGTKAVKIRHLHLIGWTASYVSQYHNGLQTVQTVIEVKTYKTEKACLKFADKVLGKKKTA